MESWRKFKKYSVISIKCWKSSNDYRPESYKVDRDSIVIEKKVIEPGKNRLWTERKRIIMPTVSPSFCDIIKAGSKKKSLGIFKPCDIHFSWEPTKPDSQERINACYAQLDLLDSRKKPIEQIPFVFRYDFRCQGEPACPGHKLLIRDWELFESYRRWRHRYGTGEILLSMIRQKWEGQMCGPKKDVHFYVGNMLGLPNRFMVLGVFWPPK